MFLGVDGCGPKIVRQVEARLCRAVKAFGSFIPYLASELKLVAQDSRFETSYLEIISEMADLYNFFREGGLSIIDFDVRPPFDASVEEQFAFFRMEGALLANTSVDGGMDAIECETFKFCMDNCKLAMVRSVSVGLKGPAMAG